MRLNFIVSNSCISNTEGSRVGSAGDHPIVRKGACSEELIDSINITQERVGGGCTGMSVAVALNTSP